MVLHQTNGKCCGTKERRYEMVVLNPETKSKNLQIKDLVEAMMCSEPCLFHNSANNLMPVTETVFSSVVDDDE